MPSVVGQKGQIVIEKPIRDALCLEPGYLTIQRLVNDHVELYFYPPEHEESLRGLLAAQAKAIRSCRRRGRKLCRLRGPGLPGPREALTRSHHEPALALSFRGYERNCPLPDG